MRPATDFTTHRLCPSRNLIICPTCGRKGFLRQYRDGSSDVAHRIETQAHGLRVVTDHCYTPRPQPHN
jgi:hypothetical protein